MPPDPRADLIRYRPFRPSRVWPVQSASLVVMAGETSPPSPLPEAGRGKVGHAARVLSDRFPPPRFGEGARGRGLPNNLTPRPPCPGGKGLLRICPRSRTGVSYPHLRELASAPRSV